jgi:hypothetical protein
MNRGRYFIKELKQLAKQCPLKEDKTEKAEIALKSGTYLFYLNTDAQSGI